MPGSRLRSYDSRELALREDDAHSLYIQQLDGEWKVKTYASPVELDSTVAMPSVDVSQWAVTRVPEQRSNGAWAAVYRTDFKLPFKWIDREVFVRLDAVSRAYYVYVNGRPAGDFADFENARLFRRDAVLRRRTQYALRRGICESRFDGAREPEFRAGYPDRRQRHRDGSAQSSHPRLGRRYPLGAGRKRVYSSFGAVVKSHLLNPKRVTVYYELIAPDSTVVSHGKRDARFELRAEDTVRFFANLPDIRSWSHESPKLYTVALKLQHEGRFTRIYESAGRIPGRVFRQRRPSDQRPSGRDRVRSTTSVRPTNRRSGAITFASGNRGSTACVSSSIRKATVFTNWPTVTGSTSATVPMSIRT